MLLPTPVGTSDGLFSRDATEAIQRVKRDTPPPSDAVKEIADDLAQVSLAGTLISRASTGSDVRFGRVASLRQAIAAGTYRVSAEELAQKLLEEMQRPIPKPVRLRPSQ